MLALSVPSQCVGARRQPNYNLSVGGHEDGGSLGAVVVCAEQDLLPKTKVRFPPIADIRSSGMRTLGRTTGFRPKADVGLANQKRGAPLHWSSDLVTPAALAGSQSRHCAAGLGRQRLSFGLPELTPVRVCACDGEFSEQS